MNKKQITVAWMMCIGVYFFIAAAMQQNNYYAPDRRIRDKQGAIYHFVRLGRRDTWNEVWKKPVISIISVLAIGGLMIYALRDKKN